MCSISIIEFSSKGGKNFVLAAWGNNFPTLWLPCSLLSWTCHAC